VVFIEHKLLYMNEGEVPEQEYTIPLAEADIKREGSDVTIIAWSNMVPRALEAANELAGEGIEAEVLDPRSLVPLDKEAILQSVKKTEHVVIVQEAVRRGGIASDIAATIQEEVFDYLDAEIGIVGGLNSPIPFNKNLEQACVPATSDIIAAVKQALYSSD
jgi:pyruvate dehydrogenase E1 component beta subunit